ncbi:MAG: hypothetical protein NZ455_06440 [Bacteroidia bacterium]|nr:hypothetical protein [Bacteroidia bacterium]MDW8347772.1 hypothetical protein [Bacteroidia bacterium]
MYKNKVKHQNTTCVRDTEHAVRQCAAQRSTERERSSPTRAQARDTPKKVKLLDFMNTRFKEIFC